jgi:hypothetical protein
MSNSQEFLQVDLLNTQPIPGESFTQEPGLRAYEKPAQITRPDQALSYLIKSTGDSIVKEKLLDVLDAGMSVETVVSGLLLNSFAEGIFNPDVAELIKGDMIQFLTDQAVKAGIEDINVTNESVEKLPDVKDKLELMKTLNPSKFDKIKTESEEQISMQDDDEINENMLEDVEEPEGFIERRSEM